LAGEELGVGSAEGLLGGRNAVLTAADVLDPCGHGAARQPLALPGELEERRP
jgi:hypothetical protein